MSLARDGSKLVGQTVRAGNLASVVKLAQRNKGKHPYFTGRSSLVSCNPKGLSASQQVRRTCVAHGASPLDTITHRKRYADPERVTGTHILSRRSL